MSRAVFVGAALVGVAAWHLVPAVLTGTIPSNWPIKPLRRTEKPVEYRITFGVFLVAGAAGLGILIAALLRATGL